MVRFLLGLIYRRQANEAASGPEMYATYPPVGWICTN